MPFRYDVDAADDRCLDFYRARAGDIGGMGYGTNRSRGRLPGSIDLDFVAGTVEVPDWQALAWVITGEPEPTRGLEVHAVVRRVRGADESAAHLDRLRKAKQIVVERQW